MSDCSFVFLPSFLLYLELYLPLKPPFCDNNHSSAWKPFFDFPPHEYGAHPPLQCLSISSPIYSILGPPFHLSICARCPQKYIQLRSSFFSKGSPCAPRTLIQHDALQPSFLFLHSSHSSSVKLAFLLQLIDFDIGVVGHYRTCRVTRSHETNCCTPCALLLCCASRRGRAARHSGPEWSDPQSKRPKPASAALLMP